MLRAISDSLQVALNRSSVAALAALLWEWAITFDTEVELIWSKSNNSWIKWMFLFSRYFVIAVHIISRGLEGSIASSRLGVSSLRVWYASQVIVAALAVCALEIVLMARVYALYNQPRWMANLLLSFLLIEVFVAIIGLLLNLPGQDFTPSTLTSHLPGSFAYFGLASVSIQFIVLVLTLRKYVKSSLKTVPLVRLMMRDGTMAFIMLMIFSTTVVVYTICNISFAVTGYAWLLSAVSCATGRLIINMQTISTTHEAPGTSTTLIFTTIFTDQIAFESLVPADNVSRSVSSFESNCHPSRNKHDTHSKVRTGSVSRRFSQNRRQSSSFDPSEPRSSSRSRAENDLDIA